MKNIKRYMAFALLLVLVLCTACAKDDGNGDYSVKCLDQNGEGVEGVTLQVCDETSCMLYTTDAQGLCRFELPAKDYEVHILKLPEGYTGDTETVSIISAGDELSLRLEK